MDWKQRFDIVKQKIKERLAKDGFRDTDENVAEFLGTSPPSFKRWRNGQMPSTSALLAIAEKLDLSIDWLLLGEPKQRITELPLSAKNHKGKYTGDLLGVVLNFIRPFEPKVEKKTGIDAKSLESLLESKSLPSFQQLEALYLNLGINPAYFFDHNESGMWIPRDMLLRTLWLLGKGGKYPTDSLLVEVFGVSWEEAESFMLEWKEAREKGRDLFLKREWVEALEERYQFSATCCLSAGPPFANPRPEQPLSRFEQKKDEEIRRLQAELLEAQREIIALYKGNRNKGEVSAAAENTASPHPAHGKISAAPLLQTKTDP